MCDGVAFRVAQGAEAVTLAALRERELISSAYLERHLPVDLAQAVMLLAAEYYEHRHDAGVRSGGLPFDVVTLIERWRTVRVLGGGGA